MKCTNERHVQGHSENIKSLLSIFVLSWSTEQAVNGRSIARAIAGKEGIVPQILPALTTRLASETLKPI